MPFDILKHVLDHLYKIINNLNYRGGKLVHFNTSAEISYFILAGFVTQSEINKIMVKIMNEIVNKEIYVFEKNGIYINKYGIEKQKYRTRKIGFKDLMLVYHNKHFDASKRVNPHFHVLGDKTSRMGKNFMYLRQALEQEASKYNIKFNFMEEGKDTGLSSVKLKNLKSMNWLFHEGDLSKIHHFITKMKNAFNRNMDSLVTHYEHTCNLSFFLKTLLIINQRLDELNLDYTYCDINLKENIFFFLLPSDIERIELLKEGCTIKINIDNVFDRELLKFAYGFETEVMDIIVNKFDIKTIEKEQLDTEEKIISNDVVKKEFIGFRDLVVMDIRNAIAIAKNEEELKSILDDMKYEKIAIKTSKTKAGKRKKIGLNIVTEKKTKMFIPFFQLRLSWSKMVMIFSHNTKKKKKKKKPKTNLDKYEKKSKKIDLELIKFEYSVPKLLKLYCKKDSNNIKIETFDDYQLDRSDLYNITTLTNSHNTIVVTENRITLKKSSDDEKIIQDMLMLAEIKGWDLSHLELSGEDGFVEKTKLQILQKSNKSTDAAKVLEKKGKDMPVIKMKL